MRITVVSMPRAGSSTFCKYLSLRHNLKNVGEILRTENSGLSVIESDNIVCKLVPQNIRGFVLDNLSKKIYTNKYAQEIIKKTIINDADKRHVFSKKHDDVIFHESMNICRQVLLNSDKIYFLNRKDIKSQILSFAAWLQQTDDVRTNRSQQVVIEDSSLIYAKDFVFNLSGIPIFKALYKEFNSSDIINTETLNELTGNIPYSKREYIYNAEILKDVNEVIL